MGILWLHFVAIAVACCAD